jgi:hypothetical protein
MRILFLAAILFLGACLHPVPDPGAIVISCTMDAVKDPKLVDALTHALQQSDWRTAIMSLINPAAGVTAEVVACVLKSLLGRLGVDPTRTQETRRARTYLTEHGYQL